jgi:phenylacetate-coenzyme A ligase PaaK-like adenylate-forming protein
MYASLVPRVLFPLYERLGGRRFGTECRDLEVIQWRSPEELEARTVRKLRALVSHAAAHVPHYRDLFRCAGIDPVEIRTVADLGRVPVTRKDELRDGYPARTVADDLPARRGRPMATSGSTGSPFEFLTDTASIDRIIGTHLFFLGWAGVGVWHARIDIGNLSDRPMASILPPPSLLVRWARRVVLGEQVVGMAGMDLRPDAVVARVQRATRRGYFFRGITSYLARLATRILEERTALPTPPRAVISFAETLTARDRGTMARAFACRVVNQYSAWEAPHMAQTCPDQPDLLHVNSERVVLRVVRDDGTPARPGESGRILLTVLDNHVMPFINYDVGDRGTAGGSCPCGRGFPTVESVEGRLSEAIVTPAGRIVTSATLDGVFRFSGAYVREYQAQQTAVDAITLRIVPTARFTSEVAAMLRADLGRYAGHDVRVEVQPVTRIDPEPSGKRLLIKARTVEG